MLEPIHQNNEFIHMDVANNLTIGIYFSTEKINILLRYSI